MKHLIIIFLFLSSTVFANTENESFTSFSYKGIRLQDHKNVLIDKGFECGNASRCTLIENDEIIEVYLFNDHITKIRTTIHLVGNGKEKCSSEIEGLHSGLSLKYNISFHKDNKKSLLGAVLDTGIAGTLDFKDGSIDISFKCNSDNRINKYYVHTNIEFNNVGSTKILKNFD